jgi:hypothetical protein
LFELLIHCSSKGAKAAKRTQDRKENYQKGTALGFV